MRLFDNSKSSTNYDSYVLVEVMVVWGYKTVLDEKDNKMLLYCCFSSILVSEHVLPFVFT